MKNEVIIIGGNHHNMLGVIRALGEKNVKSNIIITNQNKYCFVKKSKYVKECDIVKEDESAILNILYTKYSNNAIPPILIPTSDFCALVIDSNLNELKKYFIVPNIDNKQNNIKKYMDKYIQYEMVKKLNIPIAKSWDLDLTKNDKKIIPKDVSYPCILKPIISAYANKGDITICDNEHALSNAIIKYKELKYQSAILQEYIEFAQECGLIGCCYNKNIIIPGIIRKNRIFPKRQGNVSYGKVTPFDSTEIDFSPVLSLLKKINYSGMFDIEVFIKDGMFYLNEINFRNSGNTYIYTYSNVYIIYLWCLMASGIDISNECIATSIDFYFKDEMLEIKQLLHKNITLKDWYIASKKANVGFILNKNDILPVIFKFIYAIFRRLKNDE